MRPSTSIPILLAISLARAQNIDDILKRFQTAEKANDALVRQYTYTSKTTHIFFNGKEDEKSRSSETFDVIFVEGGVYSKLVARNDQPLSPAEAAKEEKKLQQTAEERRNHRQHAPLTSRVVHPASVDDMLHLYTCNITGEEEIDDRKTWVIQCDPREGVRPADDREKEKLCTSRTLWVDQKDYVPLKAIDTSLDGNPVTTAGSTITTEYALVNGEVWVAESTIMDGHLHFAKMIKPKFRTEYKNSNFKKFDVQSTITAGPQ